MADPVEVGPDRMGPDQVGADQVLVDGRRLTIVHVLNDVEDLGNGINNSTVELACAQRALGHDVVVASAGGGQVALLERYGVRHVVLVQERTPASLLGARRRWASLVRSLRPDVVHVHNLTGAVLAGAGLRRPYVLIATLHLEEKKGVGAMALADRVIAFHDAARLRSLVPGRGDRQLDVLRQGILGGARSAADDASVPDVQHPAVVTVCGMYEHKGVYDLLQAFEAVLAEVPAAHLYYVGGGPDRDELQRRVDATSYADHVHVVGFHPRPAPWLRAADVFVLASRREVAALVLAEARSFGLAPVATRAGGIPTLVEHDRSGLLSEPGDVEALGGHIVAMLTDEDLAKRLSSSAAEGLDDLTIRRFAVDVLGVYGEALAQRQGAVATASR
ncbi:glycosyltransferase family 4 protein [Kineococcus rubinsiae]|uniref:glycosyltransferase family 4 protein n=1 Tax=Kineococcus rubinsiae TaxID=2609562 RepID=UPI00142FA794|nr:glycosyltransferase family 4 protein [Kineococcus rubinsiae]NIZ92162.1 glycosyltransferase family 4 protein [Kineococcus rubinsiae]